jgi:hypothetical protein
LKRIFKIAKKYFNNEDIGWVHVISLIVILISLCVLFASPDPTNLPFNMIAGIIELTVLYVIFKTGKSSPKIKYIKLTLFLFVYLDVIMYLDDFHAGFINDTTNFILLVFPAVVGIWFFYKAFKK